MNEAGRGDEMGLHKHCELIKSELYCNVHLSGRGKGGTAKGPRCGGILGREILALFMFDEIDVARLHVTLTVHG